MNGKTRAPISVEATPPQLTWMSAMELMGTEGGAATSCDVRLEVYVVVTKRELNAEEQRQEKASSKTSHRQVEPATQHLPSPPQRTHGPPDDASAVR